MTKANGNRRVVVTGTGVVTPIGHTVDDMWTSMKASGGDESPERTQARRVLRSITMGAGARVQDQEYLKLIEKYGLRGR